MIEYKFYLVSRPSNRLSQSTSPFSRHGAAAEGSRSTLLSLRPVSPKSVEGGSQTVADHAPVLYSFSDGGSIIQYPVSSIQASSSELFGLNRS